MTLTLTEASLLLAFAQVYDNRTFDDVTAESWSMSSDPDVTIESGRAAVVDHYRRTREFIMISDVNDFSRNAARLRKERIQAAGLPDFPSGLTLIEERNYRVLFNNCVGDGMAREDAEKYADKAFKVDRQLGTAMPDEVRQAMADFQKRREIPGSQRGEPNE